MPAVVLSDSALDIVGGKLVELGLRLHQRVVAQLEIGGDLCRSGSNWSESDRAEPPCGKLIVMVPRLLLVGSAFHSVFGVTVPCGLNDSVEASAPTSCTPELVKTVDLIVAVVDDANVHQLRQLIDVLVALVQQRPRPRRRWCCRC